MSDQQLTGDFLEGALVEVEPTRVEAELAALWRPAAEQAGGSDELPAVTRVSLGTLVAVAPMGRSGEVFEVLRHLAESLPSRFVLALVADDGEPRVRAAVAAACHLPAPGQPQVCSEQIVLRTSLTGLDRLTGAVLPLLESDVPATLWWGLPVAPPASVSGELLRVIGRSVTDLARTASPEAIHAAFAQAAAPPWIDLAWYATEAWREGVARLFDQRGHASEEIARLTVVAGANRLSELYPAATVAGWVAGQLGWQPDLATVHREDLEAVSHWHRPDGEQAVIALEARPADGPAACRLLELRLETAASTGWWRLQRRHGRLDELRMTAGHRQWCRLPSVTPATRPDPVRVLRKSLLSARVNANRTRALGHAGWMLWQRR